MTSSGFKVRRATLDDLPQLLGLWQAMGFNGESLSRRITEFQVAEAADGRLAGAIGIQILGRQGLIHSESFLDFSVAEPLRQQIWDRFINLANNHGVARLWTQENAPFWRRNGLEKAAGEALEKLPADWKTATAEWLTIKLREELEEVLSADKEFALFMQSEKDRTARTIAQAKTLKTLATVVVVVVCLAILALLVLLMMRRPPGGSMSH
jgi:N-acetylglutamate synthase-like GNAT family acetyltransferase